MHTVSGVESSNPTPPHSHVQNVAATMTATGDTPVLDPYRKGSTALLMVSSNSRNNPRTMLTGCQLWKAAIDSASGPAAPIIGPI